MSAKKAKNTNSSIDSEESNKNEECLLGFSSQYRTNLYKEEDTKENPTTINDINNERNKKLSADSTSLSMSQENNNLSEINLKRISDISKEDSVPNNNRAFYDIFERQRKMSSPLFDYFDESNKYLSKMNKDTVDIKSSQNFIKKDSFFAGKGKSMKNINNINFMNEDKNNLNIKFFGQNQNIINNKINNKIMNENKNKNLDINNQNIFPSNNNILINNNITNINNYNNNCINNNLLFMNNNNYPQQIFNINYINLNNFPNNPPVNNNLMNKRKLSYNIEGGFIGNYFNNILNQKTSQNQLNLNPMLFSFNEEQDTLQNFGNNINNKINNKKAGNIQKANKKPFDKRKGDWRCPSCNNLNFAFRVICNRCKLQKPNILGDKED